MEETAIDELTRGRESTIRLEQFLQKTLPPEAQGPNSTFAGLIGEILGSFDKALSNLDSEGRRSGALLDRRSENFGGKKTIRSGRKGGYRRRAHPYSCTQQRKRTTDDGYTWRKYGQKVIFSAKHPRSYYRCTYKYDKGCQATRQVQRSEDDPTMYEITYIGEHTCRDLPDSSIIINFDGTAATNNSNQPQKVEYFDEEVISKLVMTGFSSSENLVLQDLMVSMPKVEIASCGSESTSDLQSPCGSFDMEFDEQLFDFDDIYSQFRAYPDLETM
ncbi:probable WRKY transcription factor 70 [Ananas comosus]|uniref:Probable WRKY transcription factor 70 n=1 Tax=Ananas comosus TaxID=4615 RepID=A0A6P5EG92_ANACO|nr:probable WRKY transcription factor 70 [Ananas comosus]